MIDPAAKALTNQSLQAARLRAGQLARRLFVARFARDFGLLLLAACSMAFIPLFMATWRNQSGMTADSIFAFCGMTAVVLALGLAVWNRPTLKECAQRLDAQARVHNLNCGDLFLTALLPSDRNLPSSLQGLFDGQLERALAHPALIPQRIQSLKPTRLLAALIVLLSINFVLASTPKQDDAPESRVQMERLQEYLALGEAKPKLSQSLQDIRRKLSEAKNKEEALALAQKHWRQLEDKPLEAKADLSSLLTKGQLEKTTLSEADLKRPIDELGPDKLQELIKAIREALSKKQDPQAREALEVALDSLLNGNGEGRNKNSAKNAAGEDSVELKESRDLLLRVFQTLGSQQPTQAEGKEKQELGSKANQPTRTKPSAFNLDQIPREKHPLVREYFRLREQRRRQ